MSQQGKSYHGDEVKCAGAPMCSDCKEKRYLGLGLEVLGRRFGKSRMEAETVLSEFVPSAFESMEDYIDYLNGIQD